MKVILLSVTSINGKATKGTEPFIYTWTSVEDQEIYFQKIDQAKLILMGAKTYLHAKPLIKHTKGRVRVIFTKTPNSYKKEHIPGVIEFTNDSPQAVLKRFEKQGVHEAILVGGAEINSLFLKENLISEIHATIEPLVFGSGKNIFTEIDVYKKLKLLSVKKLNTQGTLYLIYKVNTSVDS